jgi:hypothetical protein
MLAALCCLGAGIGSSGLALAQAGGPGQERAATAGTPGSGAGNIAAGNSLDRVARGLSDAWRGGVKSVDAFADIPSFAPSSRAAAPTAGPAIVQRGAPPFGGSFVQGAAPHPQLHSAQADRAPVADAPAPATTTENPVVVELYTSQGCSSCPPADELLSRLAGKEGVIALALHVDYWDYIGWADKFARPAHTKRQKAYAHANGSRTIYTPQMVINGTEQVVGARPMEVVDLLEHHAARPDAVQLQANRVGDMIELKAASPTPPLGELVVQLVRYLPRETVTIKTGENAGKTLDYANIVTSWDVVGKWDGKSVLDVSLSAPGSDPAVVIVQRPGPGPIVAAAQVP